MKHRLLAVVSGFGVLLAALAVPACAADNQLVVTQDESSMEQAIGRYLRDARNLTVEDKEFKAGDAYVDVSFKGDPMPRFHVVIDTQPLNREKDTNKVIERGVNFTLRTGIKVPNEKMDAALRVLNDFNYKKVFCYAYIDPDGEVICFWVLNVLEQGLSTEYVWDALFRVQKIWSEMFPALSAAIQ